MKYVVDASVTLRVVLQNALTAKAVQLLDDYRNQVHELIAPNIFPAELASALTKAERQKHVETALAVVGLSHRAKHYPRTLSGREQQRVGIARAIVSEPTLLLCDEPTGDLDRKAGDEILNLLQALNREHKKTIVMVTHDPHASARAARTVYLNKGQLTTEKPESGDEIYLPGLE